MSFIFSEQFEIAREQASDLMNLSFLVGQGELGPQIEFLRYVIEFLVSNPVDLKAYLYEFSARDLRFPKNHTPIKTGSYSTGHMIGLELQKVQSRLADNPQGASLGRESNLLIGFSGLCARAVTIFQSGRKRTYRGYPLPHAILTGIPLAYPETEALVFADHRLNADVLRVMARSSLSHPVFSGYPLLSSEEI